MSRPPLIRERCFELFEKHPRMSTVAMSEKYGISLNTLYNNRSIWRRQKGETVIKRPVIEHKVQFNIATFILGVALGAVLTITLAIFGA